ncbi:hypothetical protein IIZ77_02670 [Candidatus Saccharibacteria bacterium]|nr:hypothetical protein [Candidatus Saccharibacteria bacterium]
MLKNLFTGIFALALATASVPVVANHTAAADNTVILTTPFEFCEYFINKASVNDFYRTGCSAYSNVAGDQLVTSGTYRILPGENITLKNMNILYTSIRSLFTFDGGYLTIDGGGYTTAGSCFFNLTYNNEGTLHRNNNLQIISGDFSAEATAERHSQTPICVIHDTDKGDEFNETILEGVLAPNSYYTEFGTTIEIKVASNLSSGVENYAKSRDEVDGITYINRTRLSVKARSVTPTPEPEPTLEVLEEPETPETTPKTPTIIIPKAPNTGVAK